MRPGKSSSSSNRSQTFSLLGFPDVKNRRQQFGGWSCMQSIKNANSSINLGNCVMSMSSQPLFPVPHMIAVSALLVSWVFCPFCLHGFFISRPVVLLSTCCYRLLLLLQYRWYLLLLLLLLLLSLSVSLFVSFSSLTPSTLSMPAEECGHPA